MSELNLYKQLGDKPVRSDEVFHLQAGTPVPHGWGKDWLFRKVIWSNVKFENGEYGKWGTYVLFWFFRWYKGTVKCDGGRNNAYWTGQLGQPVDLNKYLMTTTPKEMFSVRLSWKKPDRERFDNMGGI